MSQSSQWNFKEMQSTTHVNMHRSEEMDSTFPNADKEWIYA